MSNILFTNGFCNSFLPVCDQIQPPRKKCLTFVPVCNPLAQSLILGLIFQNLPPQELRKCLLVDKQWKDLANAEGEKWVESIAFGQQCWEKYFGQIGQRLPLPENIFGILTARCPFQEEQSHLAVWETSLFCLIPKEVNKKSLTLNSISEMVQSPLNGGNKTNVELSPLVKAVYGEETHESYWMILTKDVLMGSRDCSFEQQQALVLKEGKGLYQIPDVISATLVVLWYIESGLYLKGQNPYTYTRCSEAINSSICIFVGGFGSRGWLDVDGNHSNCLNVCSNESNSTICGMAAIRKFHSS